MKKIHWGDIAEFLLAFTLTYILLSIIFNLGGILSGKIGITPDAIFEMCTHNRQTLISLLFSVIIGCLIMLLIGTHYDLNVKNRRAGNGQFGEARFMTQYEMDKTYSFVHSEKEIEPGFVVGFNRNGWRIDKSDQSILMVSPPGGGKTKREIIPTLKYNAMVNRNTEGQGASIIVTDSKGELESTCSAFLKEAGYSTYSLNFRYPLNSLQYNLMNNVNVYVDKAKAAQDSNTRILAQAKAEKYAKILAQSIVNNISKPISGSSESSEYFNETSEGLITAIIMLVSEYGYDGERHIISVFRLIVDLNGLSEESTETLQKNRLEQLFNLLPSENRAKLFAGPSIKADVRTSMNIFSSALGKLVSFIDSELEQMICEHSSQLSTREFINKPTVIFLIVPDEDTTKHFFSSLFIRNMMNELIAVAEANGGAFDRKVLCTWDEFGQMPPIKDFSSLVTAARSRGIRFMIALQSLGQLNERYSDAQAKTIRQAFQMTMFSYQSPNAIETAQEFSNVLGSYTTTSGSVSRSDYRSDSSSVQLIQRKLMMPEEIINMPPGTWIIMKSGCHPLKTRLKLFYEVFDDIHPKLPVQIPAQVKTIHYLTEEKIRRHAGAKIKIKPGQFDEA